MMTLQIAVPKAIGSGGGGDGSGGGEEDKINLPQLLHWKLRQYFQVLMVNNYESKQKSFIHRLWFSEELARDGVEKYLHSLIREENLEEVCSLLLLKELQRYLKILSPIGNKPIKVL